MKKLRVGRKRALVAFFVLLLSFAFVHAQSFDTITYGSVIRLQHKATKKYLSSGKEHYVHNKTSGQNAVYALDAKDDTQLWIVKGPHTANRWNCMLGTPVNEGDVVRLENVGTGLNLHSHQWDFIFKLVGHPSPATGQQEVTAYGSKGVGDVNDNWKLESVSSGMCGTLFNGANAKFCHVSTSNLIVQRFLHSSGGKFFQEGKQEVSCYWKRDDNDWFTIELVSSPVQADISKFEFQAQRGGTVNYSNILCIDPINIGKNNIGSRRLWTHGGSRHGDNVPEPDNNVEILAGPHDDARSQASSSFFMIQNVDNNKQIGPIKFGDKIKIVSLFAGKGETAKSGLLVPFKYWWLNPDSRHGKDYSEVVVSDPANTSTKNEQAEFVIESTVIGVTGEIHQNDIVQIRNLAGNKRVLWLNGDSRFGNRYYELLANNNDDAAGKVSKNFKNSRDKIFHRFRISNTVRPYLSHDSQEDFDKILVLIKEKLGDKANKYEEVFKKSKEDQDTYVKAKVYADLKAAQDAVKQYEEVAAKRSVSVQELPDEQKKQLIETAKKEQEQVNAELKKAKDQEADDKLKREAAIAIKIDTKAVENQYKLDKDIALSVELKSLKDLPAGFIKVPGSAKKVAVGLKEKVVKGKITEVNDLWAIGMDDKLMVGSGVINPWTVHIAKDDKGVEIASINDVSVGADRTTYMVSGDGKVYRYNHQGKKSVAPLEDKS